jgi:hypothetical protein
MGVLQGKTGLRRVLCVLWHRNGVHLVTVQLLLRVCHLSRSLAIVHYSNFLGFAYPAYASFRALETKDTDDDKQWSVWVCAFQSLPPCGSVFLSLCGVQVNVLGYLCVLVADGNVQRCDPVVVRER